jgi:hypothetical protein
VIIRAKQMEVFEQAQTQQFEDEMVAHSREFSPRLTEILGDEQLRVAVRGAMARARGYGFTNRGPIRLYVELMFLCGSAFDDDPQYQALGNFLRAPGDQMERATRMHEAHNDYLLRVSGPDAVNVHNALKEVLAFSRGPVEITENELEIGVLREMKRVFPQKAGYAGDEALKALIAEGAREASANRFPGARPRVLLAVLKFAFGHGCTADPLYPWISQTLQDEKIVSPEARAARLEKKALTWLEHVVANNEKRGRV